MLTMEKPFEGEDKLRRCPSMPQEKQESARVNALLASIEDLRQENRRLRRLLEDNGIVAPEEPKDMLPFLGPDGCLQPAHRQQKWKHRLLPAMSKFLEGRMLPKARHQQQREKTHVQGVSDTQLEASRAHDHPAPSSWRNHRRHLSIVPRRLVPFSCL